MTPNPFLSGSPEHAAAAGPLAAFAALPTGMQLAFAIVLGLVVGSFINVVVHRLPIMMKRAWLAEIAEATGAPCADDGLPARYNLCVPRSACPHCGHALRAWENVPVLSYIALRAGAGTAVRRSARAIRSSNSRAARSPPARSRCSGRAAPHSPRSACARRSSR
ncbi:hypothetical protein BMMON2_47870 [Burkholderia mallei]